MENELLNLLRDLVGDFPSGVNSNALEAAREYLSEAESGPTQDAQDGAKRCPECDSEIVVCMMGHYCGEVTPRL